MRPVGPAADLVSAVTGSVIRHGGVASGPRCHARVLLRLLPSARLDGLDCLPRVHGHVRAAPIQSKKTPCIGREGLAELL
eukprot:scaffold496_cov119-Isochrysis_galbana.AAC.4